MPILQRSAWITLPLTALLFLGSGIAGVGLAHQLAPDSILANFVGLLALPLVFILGMHLWLGFALATLMLRAIRRLAAGQPLREVHAPAADVPPGSYAFVFVALAVALPAGVLVGLVATTLGFFATVALYLLIGLVYGIACWLLARSGFLPFPEG